MVGASDLRPEGREFEPWPVHPRCVLRQNTLQNPEISVGTDGPSARPVLIGADFAFLPQ